MQPVSLVFNYQYPGRYAFNVLAGAVETLAPSFPELSVHFPRTRQQLLDVTLERLGCPGQVVVAWSFYSASFPLAAEELSWLGAQLGLERRRVLFLAGGVHATAETEQTLRAGFDLVAVGEGEGPLLELLTRLGQGEPAIGTAGMAWLEDGRLRRVGRGEPESLDCYPPFSLRYRKFGAIELTRGCIYACRFCQTPFVQKARFRHRSVDDVCHWARRMRDEGLRDFRFITPSALSYGTEDACPRLDRVEALLGSVREVLNAGQRLFFGTFPSEVRPEHVTPQAVRLLSRYVDNDNLIIGGQSGSDRILKATRRAHTRADVLQAVRVARQGGFLPNVDFILGLPEETEEDVALTVSLMQQLTDEGAKVHGHAFLPLPGTPYRQAPPGRLTPAAHQALEKLAGQGKLYGQWQHQQRLAARLATARPTRPVSGVE